MELRKRDRECKGEEKEIADLVELMPDGVFEMLGSYWWAYESPEVQVLIICIHTPSIFLTVQVLLEGFLEVALESLASVIIGLCCLFLSLSLSQATTCIAQFEFSESSDSVFGLWCT